MNWLQEPRILQKAIEAQLLSSLMDDRTLGIWLPADTQTWKFPKEGRCTISKTGLCTGERQQ